MWWPTPLISESGRQRQENLRELEERLVYTVSSTTARTTQRDPISKANPYLEYSG